MFSKIFAWITGIVMFFCSLFGISFVKPDSGEMLQYSADKKVVSIVIEENGTTGYRWSASNTNDKAAKLIKDDYIAPVQNGAAGVPGTRVFTFEAAAQGSTTVVLSYQRSWEQAPIRVITVKIEVLDNLTLNAEVISDISL